MPGAESRAAQTGFARHDHPHKISVPGAAGLHALRLQAFRPDGAPADFWTQTIIVGNDPTALVLPVAHNDPPGVWSITLTDAFTSRTRQEIALEVKE